MNQTLLAEQPMQMTLPLFQPLRFWTPRSTTKPAALIMPEPVLKTVMKPKRSSAFTLKGVSMKGGFVNFSGVRRMVIAGKIVKNESIAEV